MEQRPQRQGYADLNERQQVGVPALEADDEAGGAETTPGQAGGDRSDLTQASVQSGDRATSVQSPATESAADELAESVDEGGAQSGGRRPSGDGGSTPSTGG